MLTWKVFREDINTDKIEDYNIFEHGSFLFDLVKLKQDFNKKFKSIYKDAREGNVKDPNLETKIKEELKTGFLFPEVDKLLRHYFWARSEYEVVIASWPSYISKEELERLNTKEFRYVESVELTVERKVDVYEQINLNKDAFYDYLWKNFENIPKKV